MLRGFDRVGSLKSLRETDHKLDIAILPESSENRPERFTRLRTDQSLKHLAHMPGNPVFIGIIGGPLWNSDPFAVICNDPLLKSAGAVGGFGDDDRHGV